jgi:hypothetical protein
MLVDRCGSPGNALVMLESEIACVSKNLGLCITFCFILRFVYHCVPQLREMSSEVGLKSGSSEVKREKVNRSARSAKIPNPPQITTTDL